MMQNSLQSDVALACEQAEALMTEGERVVIAVAGPPASGKSTLAESMVSAFNERVPGSVPRAALLPMDGYHLDNSLLEARRLLARKGAPETFNAIGFCDSVKQLKTACWETFHPTFDRHMDLSIASSIAIHPETPFVVVEGNYLLLRSQPWASIYDTFDLTIFVCPTMEELRGRLTARWRRHGLDAETAMAKVLGNDLPNAELVIAESRDADLLLSQNYPSRHVHFAN